MLFKVIVYFHLMSYYIRLSPILFSLFLSSVNRLAASSDSRRFNATRLHDHYYIACLTIQISLSSAQHFSRSVPIGLDVRRALKLAVGLAIAQRSSTIR